jgi:hypothetical protein
LVKSSLDEAYEVPSVQANESVPDPDALKAMLPLSAPLHKTSVVDVIIAVGNALTTTVSPAEVALQPAALVALTVTTSPLVNVELVKVAVVEADPCDVPLTKNS